jgi:predicted regulator of Ras-like GTPase activity (Roadblock/LC7/MglB family)
VNVDVAIHDLLNFSTDIRAVAVIGEAGEVVAAVPGPGAVDLSGAAAALWQAAEAAASDGDAKPLEHVVVQDKDGVVAMLHDGTHRIVAVTGPKPAIGLLLFDLRTCLGDAYPEEAS